jgi:hypothetical protein
LGDIGELDWLQNKARVSVREMRRVKVRRLEEEGGARGHRRRRMRPEEPADVRRFGDKFLGDWLRFLRDIKGR